MGFGLRHNRRIAVFVQIVTVIVTFLVAFGGIGD
jgi:hypothetical protein